MPKYRIGFIQTASTYAEAEADTLEQAIDLAWDELPSGVCSQCSGHRSNLPGIDLSGDWEPSVAYDEDHNEIDLSE